MSRALPRCTGTPPPIVSDFDRTVYLPPELWARVKARATALGVSPRDLAHEAAYLGAQDVRTFVREAR